MIVNTYSPGPICVKGCAFDDFILTNHLPPDQAPLVIERDRLFMSARPGFNRKLLPLRIERESGVIYSGGRYLFDTYENAVAFSDWCRNEFELDGVLILERPDFAEVTAQVYHVIGAYDFKDVHTSQIAYRSELWRTSDPSVCDKLANLWPQLRDRAAEEGRASLWLIYNDEIGEVGLVTVTDRVGARNKTGLDYATLDALESATSYGLDWQHEGWVEKTFDRSHWVFTVWFPNNGDADTKPALWPNSPPLPSPFVINRAKSAA